MFTPPKNDRQSSPLRPPINQSHSENSASNPNSPGGRRRTSSFGFPTSFFSNLTSLRSSSSSSNIQSQLGAQNGHQHSALRSRASSHSRLNIRQTFQANNNSSHSISRSSRNNSVSNLHQHHTPNTTSNTNQGNNITNTTSNTNTIERLESFIISPSPGDPFQDQTRSNSFNASQPTPVKVAQKLDSDGTYSVRLTPFIDHSSNSSGLYFAPVLRKIKPNTRLPIGRYTDKVREHAQAPPGSSAPVVFKSKVVSRTHAEFYVDEYGDWFVKDLKSSSGTFLNHIRLSPAGTESLDTPIQNGDVLQLGMDFRGGVEDIFRCVKMRVEMNKSWQRKTSHFDKEVFQKFKALTLSDEADMTECAICLFKVKPCQPVFISPCSHSWHYKCIRPIVLKSYPQFLCPNCRETCDLEADDDESQLESSDDEESDLLDGESQSSQLKRRGDHDINVLVEEEAADLVIEEVAEEAVQTQ